MNKEAEEMLLKTLYKMRNEFQEIKESMAIMARFCTVLLEEGEKDEVD